MKGGWSKNKTPEEVKEIMRARGKQFVEKKTLAFATLKKVEEIKKQWKEDEGRWSKTLKETIVTNLFQ